ncbi:MAG: tryptophan-rich sensory protein [Anaerolineae bacterium]|nr:tryptophan-rich sensory protein [Anaerolineae bacterium]
MSKGLARQVVTVIATVVMITVNVLANALPINGQNTGEISDRFDVYFTPAGYVFSIWGLIYLGLIAYTIYQALPAQRDNDVLHRIAPWYWLSSAANIAWIFLWHYTIFYATIIAMGALLTTLILIYLGLDIRRASVSAAMKWLVHLPFSVYLGWITVATIANAASLLWLAKWTGFGIGAEAWTAIVLAVAVLIAGAMAFTRADVAYLLVLVWAFIGIAVKHPGVPLVFTSAWIATGVVAVMAIVSLIPHGPLPIKSAR